MEDQSDDKLVQQENFFGRPTVSKVKAIVTLRQCKDPDLIIECRACDRRDTLDRKALVKRYGASLCLDRLRRQLALGCERMNGLDGVDRCQTRFVGLSAEIEAGANAEQRTSGLKRDRTPKLLSKRNTGTGMCNLYNVTTNQEAIRSFVSITHDLIGNMEPSIDVYPDRFAPIVRNTAEGGRELVPVRWGMPSSKQALFQAASKRADKLRAKDKPVDFDELLKMEPDGGTTNIRNTLSKHWTRWLGVENRCVVPLTRFAEPDPGSKIGEGRTPNAWFESTGYQPLMFFAGIWLPQWTSVRKIKEGLATIDLFAFLTTEPNELVAPIHQKAMPAILTEPEEVEMWLTAPWEEARVLQRPLADGKLKLVPVADDFVAA
jgi:putative SOS response-associated peptidase YedK